MIEPGLRMVQVAYTVDDVRTAARAWHEATGIGPFFVREHVPTERVTASGEDGVFDHTCALEPSSTKGSKNNPAPLCSIT